MKLIISFYFFIATAVFSQDLYRAAYNGDLETVKTLIEKDNSLVNSLNTWGRFPLEMAAQTGKIEVVKYLLSKGADITMERNGSTALHMAALYGGNTDVINLLLDEGADVNAKTSRGATPLNYALYGKQKEIADLLLDRGGEINLEGADKTEFLYTAVSAGIKRIVDLLTDEEIDFGYMPVTGNTFLHSAAEGGLYGFLKFLLEKGLNADQINVYGYTPLHIAAEKGEVKIAELLLEYGADINRKTFGGRSPLNLASQANKTGIVNMLREKGAEYTEWEFPLLKGKYLDQPEPGDSALLFAPDIISEEKYFEHSTLAFSGDYSEIYWSTDYKELGFYNIVGMKYVENKWTPPQLAPFSVSNHAGSPVFSPEGNKLFFSSTRKINESSTESDENIWVVEKEENGWSEPVILDKVINSEEGESVFCQTSNGTLYFRRGTSLMRSKFVSGSFSKPELFDIDLIEGERVLHLFVAPDESFYIRESINRSGFGGADLFVSFKDKNGKWSDPINMGPKINSGGHERFPSVTPDGKFLFFLRVGDASDFYWVSSNVIEKLKPQNEEN